MSDETKSNSPWYKDGGVIIRIGVLIAVTIMVCLGKLEPLTAVAVMMGLYGGSMAGIGSGGGKKLLGAVFVAGALGIGLGGCGPMINDTCEDCTFKMTSNPTDCATPIVAGGKIVTGKAFVVKVLSPRSICTGVLVATDVVLTAGHCVVEGDMTIDLWGATYVVVDRVVHPTKDLAILYLDQPVINWLGRRLQPVIVYTGPISEGARIVIYGHGAQSATERDSTYVRAGEQVIYEVKDDEYTFWGLPGVCDGDSGGPTLYGSCLLGIHLARLGACGEGSIDLRLAAFSGWLRENIRS
jgi:hypothetical protein